LLPQWRVRFRPQTGLQAPADQTRQNYADRAYSAVIPAPVRLSLPAPSPDRASHAAVEHSDRTTPPRRRGAVAAHLAHGNGRRCVGPLAGAGNSMLTTWFIARASELRDEDRQHIFEDIRKAGMPKNERGNTQDPCQLSGRPVLRSDDRFAGTAMRKRTGSEPPTTAIRRLCVHVRYRDPTGFGSATGMGALRNGRGWPDPEWQL
jgi:hypothetical protein